jgi:hypothetical protein
MRDCKIRSLLTIWLPDIDSSPVVGSLLKFEPQPQ